MPGSLSSSIVSRLSTRSSSSKLYKCTIQLLDDNETTECEFKRSDTGQVILDYVCDYLQVLEKDYFGLRFMDFSKHRYWLDPAKPIFKQIHGITPIVFCLRIRYYPADPSVLKEEITRYQLFLQLRRDMLHGRLYCPQTDAVNLGACIIQSELGDYSPDENAEGYVSEYKLFLKQTNKLEDKIAHQHKTLVGQNPAQAELNFLERASALDTYGFDPYTVKDMKNGGSVYVGVSHKGILVYQANRKIHHIRWEDLDKVDYLGKEYRIYPKLEYFQAETLQDLMTADGLANGSKEPKVEDDYKESSPASKKRSAAHILKFQCPSATFAKHLWRYTLAQQAFFTLDKSIEAKPQVSKRRIPVFTRGSTFRFSGRVLHEIEETEAPSRTQPAFVRIHVERQPSRDERAYPWMNKYSTMPRATKKENEYQNDVRSQEAPELGSVDRPQSMSLEPVVANAVSGMDSPDLTLDLSPGLEDTQTTEHQERLVDDGSLIANSPSYESQLQAPLVDSVLSEPKPLANSTPLKAPNGHVPHSEPQSTESVSISSPPPRSSGLCTRILRHMFTGLLLSIIIVGLVVAVLEVRDRGFQRYVHVIPGMERFRHLYYEPSRRYMLDVYSRYAPSSSGGWLR